MSLSDLPDKPTAYENMIKILKATNRAKKILSLRRQSKQEMQPIKIDGVIKEAIKLLRGLIPTTINIRDKINKNCGYIYGYLTQIHQIIMNLYNQHIPLHGRKWRDS